MLKENKIAVLTASVIVTSLFTIICLAFVIGAKDANTGIKVGLSLGICIMATVLINGLSVMVLELKNERRSSKSTKQITRN